MALSHRLVRRPPQEPLPEPVHYQEVLERFLATKDSINTRDIYRRAVLDFFERVGITDVTRLDGDDIIAYNGPRPRRARRSLARHHPHPHLRAPLLPALRLRLRHHPTHAAGARR